MCVIKLSSGLGEFKIGRCMSFIVSGSGAGGGLCVDGFGDGGRRLVCVYGFDRGSVGRVGGVFVGAAPGAVASLVFSSGSIGIATLLQYLGPVVGGRCSSSFCMLCGCGGRLIGILDVERSRGFMGVFTGSVFPSSAGLSFLGGAVRCVRGVLRGVFLSGGSGRARVVLPRGSGRVVVGGR